MLVKLLAVVALAGSGCFDDEAADLDASTGADAHLGPDAAPPVWIDSGRVPDDGGAPEPFTVAVLPDTQGYSQFFPEIYDAQMEWLAASRDDLNIVFAVHLGDLVEGSWLAEQWEVSRAALGLLDGVVPYAIAPGNHDYGEVYDSRNARDRSTLLDTYFPRWLFESMPTFGGFYDEGDRVDNSFHLFTAGGESWLVMALEFGPRDEVLAWARDVIADHPAHRVILAVHAYLFTDGSGAVWDDARYDWAVFGETQQWNPHAYGIGSLPDPPNDGQEIWDELVSLYPNIMAVLCGHVLNDGVGHAVSHGAGEVHEILSNYQMNNLAGEGFLRLMRFDPASRLVEVSTYSPWTDTYKTDSVNQFSFEY